MSLEDLIKEETGNNLKEKFIHYSKFTATSFYRGAIDMFRLSTANRLRKEAENCRAPKFLEEVIKDSVRGSLQVFMLGTFFLSPPLGLTALATNTASYIYEKRKTKFKIHNPVQVLYQSMQNLVDKIKKYSFKKSLRNFARFACTYTLVGSMALGHFFASSTLRAKPEYNPNMLNIETQKISLEREGKKYEFYLLSEVHLYNYSSSINVKNLIEQKNISLLLSEGVDLGQEYYRGEEKVEFREVLESILNEKSWKNICEEMIGATYAVILLGGNYFHDEPSEICYKKNIPVIFLEKPVFREYEKNREEESNSIKNKDVKDFKDFPDEGKEKETFLDGREGVGNFSYAVLGATGIMSVLCAPQMYFLSSSGRYFPMKNLNKLFPLEILFKGIIDERNKLMTEEAFNQIKENSKDICLIRIGIAHQRGVIEELKKYGNIEVENVEIEVK